VTLECSSLFLELLSHRPFDFLISQKWLARRGWLMPVIPATQELEIRRIEVLETLS
jgi:hypothetical protein